jgi:hypothetical protein
LFPLLGSGKHCFEAGVLAKGIHVRIDLGVSDETCAHLFEHRAKHL